jgi:hypothetical protein
LFVRNPELTGGIAAVLCSGFHEKYLAFLIPPGVFGFHEPVAKASCHNSAIYGLARQRKIAKFAEAFAFFIEANVVGMTAFCSFDVLEKSAKMHAFSVPVLSVTGLPR